MLLQAQNDESSCKVGKILERKSSVQRALKIQKVINKPKKRRAPNQINSTEARHPSAR